MPFDAYVFGVMFVLDCFVMSFGIGVLTVLFIEDKTKKVKAWLNYRLSH